MQVIIVLKLTYSEAPRCTEKKPGGKNDSGKKAWCVLKNMEKKPGIFFSKHITINDEVELNH